MANAIGKLSLLLLPLLLCGVLRAQPKLTVDSAWTVPADSMDFNGNPYYLNYQVVVENIGNAKLDGGIDILMRYNGDSVEYLKTSFQVVDFEVGMQFQVGFTDTIANLSGNRYKGGDNVLVIWPKAESQSVQAPDTGIVSIYIKDLSIGTREALDLLRTRVSLFPNPASDLLHMQFMQDRNKLEYVRIATLDGRELLKTSDPLELLRLSDFPSGVLMIDIQYNDGIRGTFKVMHIE